MPKVKDIMSFISGYAPEKLAYDWDNVGLQVGDPDVEVSKVMVALDPTPEIVKQAIDAKVELLVTHHPLIFKPMSKIIPNSETGKIVFDAIRNNLNILSAHTNLDITSGGVNHALAECLGLNDIKPLKIEYKQKMFKIAVFVPMENLEKVRNAMCDAGAGIIGDYSYCSFRIPGTGSFYPEAGAKPHIGEVGKLEEVEEVRLEVLCPEELINKVTQNMVNSHPYEEVAYDVYPLQNTGEKFGLGCVGKLSEKVEGKVFLKNVKKKLGLEILRYTGSDDKSIEKVAVCGGSGATLVKLAVKEKCDAYVTADIKYHEALSALTENILLVDGGHYYTERLIVPVLVEEISKAFPEIHIESVIGKDAFRFL